MLVVKQKAEQPLVIGDVIVYVERDGESVKVGIDAPPSVNIVRGDIVERKIDKAGMRRAAYDRWVDAKGVIRTTREMLAHIGAMG